MSAESESRIRGAMDEREFYSAAHCAANERPEGVECQLTSAESESRIRGAMDEGKEA